MKRAPVVITATVAGLAAALGYHAQTKTATTATAPAATAQPASSSSSSTSSSSTKTATGDASTPYGGVELKVTISGGKITDIQALSLPSADPKSVEIASYAAPQLRQSALTKQSANVDVVSGATYTSDGYKTALQAALDKAGFQSSTGSSSAA
jgi:uncharacterized protein with FMN-binding domain